ncbi:MAG: hypothetical protein LAO77_12365 [Acidobacteriia bacterium]|nr:hypothetical protein [Terriglobia bacterium]
MATATLDPPRASETAGTGVRVMNAVRQAAHAAHEAKVFTSIASDAVEDGVHAAKRAVTRGVRDLADMRDTAEYKIKRAPFAAIGLAFGAGVVLGMIGCGIACATRMRRKAGEV